MSSSVALQQNIAEMLRRNNVNIVRENNDEEAVNNGAAAGAAAGADDDEEEGVNDAQEVGHDEGSAQNEMSSFIHQLIPYPLKTTFCCF